MFDDTWTCDRCKSITPDMQTIFLSIELPWKSDECDLKLCMRCASTMSLLEAIHVAARMNAH